MANLFPIGVLVSGSGTNLQAILDAVEEDRLPAAVRLVVSNRAQAKALDRARAHGAACEVIDHKAFPSREAFDEQVVSRLQACGVELVCLAGFDRLISSVFVRAFADRILNIHPALLPAFPGLRAPAQAVAYGVKIAGATVHLVDEETDHGPIVIQAAVPVFDDDSEESLAARILAEEHRIYPEAICLFAEGRVLVEGRRVRILDQSPVLERSLVNPPIE